MLNRHFLRVKALQTFYAYEQAKAAHYQLARDFIYQKFEPDWDEKPTADWDAIAQNRQEAQQLFAEYYEQRDQFINITATPAVKQTVLEAINLYHTQVQRDRNFLQRQANGQVEGIYEHYIAVLQLLIALGDEVAQEQRRVEQSFTRRETIVGDFKLANNAILKVLRQNTQLQTEVARRNAKWDNEAQLELVREWYKSLVREDASYQAYNEALSTSFEQDREILQHLLRELIVNQKAINTFRVSEVYWQGRDLDKLHRSLSFNDLHTKLARGLEAAYVFFAQEHALPQASPTDLLLRFKAAVHELPAQYNPGGAATSAAEQHPRDKKRAEVSAEESRTRALRQRTNALLKCAAELLVQACSDLLVQHKLHYAAHQAQQLEAINEALSIAFTALDLSHDEPNQITLQIEMENAGGDINEYFEKRDINWSENGKTVQSMVQKTLKNIASADDKDFALVQLSLNWEDDRQFYQDLIQLTIEHDREYEGFISQKAQNWDLSRLAMLDKAILKMAITEMVHFHSIPTKVSINEYIEIAKAYSTPKSKQFINGLLDAISQELVERKIIRKSGRGLMDNK